MDALGNFKFIFWVATLNLLCTQPELDQTKHCAGEIPSLGGLPFSVATQLPLGGGATLAQRGGGLCVLRCGDQMFSFPGSTSCVQMVSSWETRGGVKRRLGTEEPDLASPCLTQSLIDTWGSGSWHCWPSPPYWALFWSSPADARCQVSSLWGNLRIQICTVPKLVAPHPSPA